MLDDYPELADRLRRPESKMTVPGTLPVLFFGDMCKARVATVGLNPSWKEYLKSRSPHEEFSLADRRLETLASLGVPSRGDLTEPHIATAVTAMRDYFNGRPYRGFFGYLEKVLEATGYSFTTDAVHLDLVQEATDPTWSQLPREQLAALREQDEPFLSWLLGTFPIGLVLADGRTARELVSRRVGAELEPMWSIGNVNIHGGVGHISGRRVVVLGWNRPLVRAGLTNEQLTELGEWVAAGPLLAA